jgi:regulator of protease activity HflC (stomatin/prohibitin superfamily)
MKRIMLAFVAVLMLVGCGQVNQGERAVFSRWGVMAQQTYGPGLYFYEPFGTNMDTLSVQIQKHVETKLGAATADTQPIHADIAVNYHLSPGAVHLLVGNIGYDFVGKVLQPAIIDALKAGTAQFHLAKIIQDREKLRAIVLDDLKARMLPKYIIITDLNLTNFDVSKEFIHAVEAKQIAEQNVITATREAESARATAKGVADAAREAAGGAADATRLAAKAEADRLDIEGAAKALYNKKVSDSLTPILIQNQAIGAWQAGGSQVPHITGAGGLLIQVPAPAVQK